MNEITKALNDALQELPWWKKLIFISVYPMVWWGTWSAWRGEEMLKKSRESEKGKVQ